MLNTEYAPLRNIALAKDDKFNQKFGETFAREICSSFIPVNSVEKYRINDNPLLWLDARNILSCLFLKAYKIYYCVLHRFE
jgi:hypothetical protein